jgi:hypothetical protein
MLRKWKQTAEERSFRAIVALTPTTQPSPQTQGPDDADQQFVERLNLSASEDLEAVTVRLVAAAREDVAAFKRMPIWPRHAIALNLTMQDGQKGSVFDASALAAAAYCKRSKPYSHATN